jgi:hypothetical protein
VAVSRRDDSVVATTLGAAVVWRLPSGALDLAHLPALARCSGYAVRDQVLVPSPPPADCP